MAKTHPGRVDAMRRVTTRRAELGDRAERAAVDENRPGGRLHVCSDALRAVLLSAEVDDRRR